MARYWVISPYNLAHPEIWDRAWEYDLSNGVIAITWKRLGDTSGYGQDELRRAIEEKYQDKNQWYKSWSFNSMWRFWHEIKVGDIILARRGTKQIAGVGTVTREAFYDEVKGSERVGGATEDCYSDFIGVAWHDSPRDVRFDKPQFAFMTICEIDKAKYDGLMTGHEPEPEVTRE